MVEPKRLRILLSCYSCGPDRGSEPGVGWNAALALAELHEVHVLTTTEFQHQIEEQIAKKQVPESLHFHFFELPLGRWWWRYCKTRGIRIHYYLWQLFATFTVRRMHWALHFDSAQHVTFVCYWAPSCLTFSGIPYIFGPVGGAEYTPKALRANYSVKAKLVEVARDFMRWLGEHDPFVRLTIRKAAYVLAATQETAERCLRLGAITGKMSICSGIALSDSEFQKLSRVEQSSAALCFFGMGRLIYWKGFDLALKAFALANIPGSRFLLIGGGPDEARLRKLAEELGVSERCKITGFLPRQEALSYLAETHILLHASHHDSGGLACLEALAAGRPVICLNWAGPRVIVTQETGALVEVGDEQDVIEGLVEAMGALAGVSKRQVATQAARRLVGEKYLWSSKVTFYSDLHRQIRSTTALSNEVCLRK